MLLSIDHSTTYTYGKKIVLAPHTVRLHPKNDCAQKILAFSLETEPAEVGRSVNSDLDGNTSVTLWFAGESERLTIHTKCLVETLKTNPFDFIISDHRFLNLPMRYPGEQTDSLLPYTSVSEETARAVSALREFILEETQGKTLDFLLTLCGHIRRFFPHVIREDGDPWPAAKTLSEKKGSCRDLVELFVSVCRSAGLACRYVSGYAFNEKKESQDELHAWAEVYLPGAGWRGYDPSSGLAVSDCHVAVAAGANHKLIAPVEGTFYGDGAQPKLEFKVDVRKAEKKDL